MNTRAKPSESEHHNLFHIYQVVLQAIWGPHILRRSNPLLQQIQCSVRVSHQRIISSSSYPPDANMSDQQLQVSDTLISSTLQVSRRTGRHQGARRGRCWSSNNGDERLCPSPKQLGAAHLFSSNRIEVSRGLLHGREFQGHKGYKGSQNCRGYPGSVIDTALSYQVFQDSISD